MTRRADALLLLKVHPRCGQELVEAGVGYRYPARIFELRQEGHEIEKWVCEKHDHRSTMYEYGLVGWDDGQGEFAL